MEEVHGNSPLLAFPPPTKSFRHLSPRPLSVAGPQISLERSEYGGSLPSSNDNDRCFRLRVGGGLRGKAGLRCLVRQTSVVPSGQAHPSSIVPSEDIWSTPSPGSPILSFPDVVLRVGLPSGGRSIGDSSQERPAVSASGQNLAPTSRDLEVVGMDDHRSPLAFDLSDGVRETINSARTLSTRKLYSSKWKVFEPWCLVYAVDPVSCPVCSVLEFLQDKFLAGVAATTLRVYVAAITARRDSDDVQLGRHHLVSSFMRRVKRLRPLRPPSFPSWDLSVVLNGLLEPPFDPLESAFLRILTRYSFVGIGLA